MKALEWIASTFLQHVCKGKQRKDLSIKENAELFVLFPGNQGKLWQADKIQADDIVNMGIDGILAGNPALWNMPEHTQKSVLWGTFSEHI